MRATIDSDQYGASLQCHACSGRGSSTTRIAVTGFTDADTGYGGVLHDAIGYARRSYDPPSLAFNACPSCLTKLARRCDTCGNEKPMDRDHCPDCARAFAVADRQEKTMATNIKAEAEKLRAEWDAKQAQPAIGAVKVIDGALHVADAKGEWIRIETAPFNKLGFYGTYPAPSEKLMATNVIPPTSDSNARTVELIQRYIEKSDHMNARAYCGTLPNDVLAANFTIDGEGRVSKRNALVFAASAGAQAVGVMPTAGHMLVSDGTGYALCQPSGSMTEVDARAVLDHARQVLARVDATVSPRPSVESQMNQMERMIAAVNAANAATVQPRKETAMADTTKTTTDKAPAPNLMSEAEQGAWRAGIKITVEEGRDFIARLLTADMEPAKAKKAQALFVEAFQGRFGVPIVATILGGMAYGAQTGGVEIPFLPPNLVARIGSEMRTLAFASTAEAGFRVGQEFMTKHGGRMITAITNLGRLAERTSTGIRVDTSQDVAQAPAATQTNGNKSGWVEPPAGAVEAQRRANGSAS